MIFKRIISVILIGFLLMLMVQPSLKIIGFYKNQAEIIAKHCVNKDKPVLKCEGHCYLEKQLKQDKNQSENNAFPEVLVFMPIAANCWHTIKLNEPSYSIKKALIFGPSDQLSSFQGEIFTPPKSIV